MSGIAHRYVRSHAHVRTDTVSLVICNCFRLCLGFVRLCVAHFGCGLRARFLSELVDGFILVLIRTTGDLCCTSKNDRNRLASIASVFFRLKVVSKLFREWNWGMGNAMVPALRTTLIHPLGDIFTQNAVPFRSLQARSFFVTTWSSK